MLTEHTLFGTRDKVQTAIARIQAHVPPEGCTVAFSGGKDSTALLALVQMAQVPYTAVFNRTTVDPPEVEAFITTHHPDVVWNRPALSMFQMILQVKHWPPLRRQRWCCQEFKERHGEGLILTGVRWEESPSRNQRRMAEPCMSSRRRSFLHPLIDWTANDVWAFIRRENLPYCDLYDQGFDRVGCILCPMATNPQQQIERWPRFAAAYIRTFDRLLEIRDQHGKSTQFKSGEEMFTWWVQRHIKAKTRHPDQPSLFD